MFKFLGTITQTQFRELLLHILRSRLSLTRR